MNGRLDTSRAQLMAKADMARARLLHTVAELDRRRHDALNVGNQVRRHMTGLLVLAGVSVVGLAGGALYIVHRAATAASRRRRERWRVMRRVWAHPERFGSEPQSFGGKLWRSIAMGVLTTLAVAPARAFVRRVFESPRPPKTLPPAPARLLPPR
jgi:hypothetical protein